MKIDFGMIDAKDSEVISIDGYRALNKHNAILMGQAEAEYLNELLYLQTKIKEKYEPKLIENKSAPEFDMWDADEIADEERRKTIKEGAGSLWYS